MENEIKDNIKQFKKEFKGFIKNTVDGFKSDEEKEKNDKSNEKNDNKDKDNEKNQENKKHQEAKQESQQVKTSKIIHEGLNMTKLFIGSLIILIGVVFLLSNFNIIIMDMSVFLSALFKLWPLLIILAGISVLNKKHIISSILSIIFISFMLLIIAQIFFTYKNFGIRQIDEHTFRIERKFDGDSNYGWKYFNIEVPNEQQFKENW